MLFVARKLTQNVECATLLSTTRQPSSGKHVGKQCFMNYHNTPIFGVAYCDRRLANKSRTTWHPATKAELAKNARGIKDIQSGLDSKNKNKNKVKSDGGGNRTTVNYRLRSSGACVSEPAEV